MEDWTAPLGDVASRAWTSNPTSGESSCAYIHPGSVFLVAQVAAFFSAIDHAITRSIWQFPATLWQFEQPRCYGSPPEFYGGSLIPDRQAYPEEALDLPR